MVLILLQLILLFAHQTHVAIRIYNTHILYHYGNLLRPLYSFRLVLFLLHHKYSYLWYYDRNCKNWTN